MKSLWIALGVSLAVIGAAGAISLACGPKEHYCYDKGVACSEVKDEQRRMCQDKNAEDEDAGRPGNRDCGM